MRREKSPLAEWSSWRWIDEGVLLRNWPRVIFAVLVLSVGHLGVGTADDLVIVVDTDAAAHVGQTVTVQGLVASVFVSPKGNEFLNFERPYPNQVFSVAIFSDSAGHFGDIAKYQGKQVLVTGRIKLYKGKPEIILQSPNQLHVVQ